MFSVCDNAEELDDGLDVEITTFEDSEVSDVEFDDDNGAADVELTLDSIWRLTRSFSIDWSW